MQKLKLEAKKRKKLLFEPTVLTDVPIDAKMMNEEPFGPIAPIAPFRSFDEVVEEANRLPYGLAAFALLFAKLQKKLASIESGIVSVNQPWMPVVEVPSVALRIQVTVKSLERRAWKPICNQNLLHKSVFRFLFK